MTPQSRPAAVPAPLKGEPGLAAATRLLPEHGGDGCHPGGAREVVSRMLKYFQGEGLVALGRGSVTLLDKARLRETAGGSIR